LANDNRFAKSRLAGARLLAVFSSRLIRYDEGVNVDYNARSRQTVHVDTY